MDSISGPKQQGDAIDQKLEELKNQHIAQDAPAPIDITAMPQAASVDSVTHPSTPTDPLDPEKRGLQRPIGITLIVLSLITAGLFVIVHFGQKPSSTAQLDASSKYGVQSSPAPSLTAKLAAISQSDTLTVNGLLSVTGSLILSPTVQPTNAVTGQMYYDSAKNLLGYYNGSNFVYLQGGGNVTNTTINNVTNPATTNNVTNVTNVSGGGIGGSGTAGQLAMFTAPSVLGDSMINQNGSSLNTGSGVESVALGSQAGVSDTTLQGGTGGVSINTGTSGSTTGAIAINTGPSTASTGGITIQSGDSSTTAAGNINIDTGASVLNGTVISDETFENGTDNVCNNIFGDNTSVAQSTTEAHAGTHSLAVTVGSNAFPQWGVGDGCQTPPFQIAVTGGHTYAFEAWVRAGTTSSTITASVVWSNDGYGGGGEISQVNFGSVTDISSGWRKVDGILTAPVGSVEMGIEFTSFDATTIGEVHYFDDITVTDLSSSSATAAINLGATNAQEITIGNSGMLAATSIYGGGINLNGGTGILSMSAGTITAASGGATYTTTSGALDITSATTALWKIAGSGGAGGDLNIQAGAAGGNNDGGNIYLQGGSGAGTGAQGDIVAGSDGGVASSQTIRGGNATGDNILGPNLNITAGDGTGVGGSGNINFYTAGGVANPAVTLDATSGAEQAASNATLNWTHTTGAEGNMVLIVAVDTTGSLQAPSTVTGVTYNGTPLTPLTSLVDPGINFARANGSVWYLANPPVGPNTVSVSISGNPSDIGAESTTFFNVDTSNPIANFATNQTNGTSVSTALTGTNPGEGIFDAMMTRASIGNSVIPGVGQTALYGQGFNSDANYGSFRQGQSGSTTMSWTGNGVGADINHVVMALNPEPNVTPDTLSQTLSITQAGTLGIDLSSTENSLSTISFGGTADQSIGVNQNPTTGNGHNLTIQAGTGAVGANNGGDLLLQGGAATGSGSGGSVVVKPQTDSASAFQVQNASGAPLLVADTAGMKITVKALVVDTTLTVDGHIISGGVTPTWAVGSAANCSGSGAVTVTGDDTAGTVTITTGAGPCSSTGALATVNFATPYGATPPHVTLTPAEPNASTLQYYYTAATGASFTINTNNAVLTGATTYKYSYLVVQ